MPRQLSIFEAACVVAGNGIGGGLMALPYLAARVGLPISLLVLAFAWLATCALHWMVADMLLSAKGGSGILSVFEEFLFRGRLRKPLSLWFFALLGVTLLCNLSAYVTGGADILYSLFGLGLPHAKWLFYLVAAAVPMLGLTALGVSEKAGVTVMLAMTGALAILSFARGGQLPLGPDSAQSVLALYGLSMFSFSALFSVPQVVEGLGGDRAGIRRAIALGVGINLAVSAAIVASALLASAQVTEVAIIGWSQRLGRPVMIIGSLLVLLAMITSYWAIGLALSDMVQAQLRLKSRPLCFALSSLPCLVLALVSGASFTAFVGIAGGAVAVIIALLLIPAYCNARRGAFHPLLPVGVGICYLLMAAGSMLAV